ncbi:18549_t:CDS:2, partial [Gigaspora margarita]
MSEQIIEIPSEQSPPHNGKKITKIVCSPKLKYVATWSDEDISACIYSIEGQTNLEFKICYPLKELVEHDLSGEIKNDFLKAEKYELKLSDQKHIALMPYDEGYRHAALFTLERHEVKILEPRDNKKEIIESNFIINEGDYYLLVRREKNSNSITGYIFELCGKLKKIFRVSNYNYSKDHIVLHNNGYIFIYKRDTHIIMAWNTVTLEFIAYLTTEWEIDCIHPYIFTEKRHKETEEISELEFNQSYIINYSMVFYIDENKLKAKTFPESWRDKFNNMATNLVANEVFEEIEKEDEYISLQPEMSKIRINYFWSSSTSFQKEYKERLPYLPPPEFEFEKSHDLYELMIEDYSNSRFKLSLYGRYLMEHLLENEKFESIETLLKNIINLTIKNSDRSFISNLPLMKIITYNLRKLSYYPEIINWFLSRITFFVPDDTLSEIISTNSTSNHLQKFGEYPNIFDTSLIYLKIESFLNLMFIIFKHSKFYLRIIIPMPKIFTQHKRKKTTIKLVFPLMGLTDYSLGSYFMKNLDFEYSTIEKKFISFIDTIFDAYSSFGFSLETNLYELWIGEALLTYKWNTYGRAIHIINLFIHLFCLTCFVLTVISYDQISSFIRLFLLSIVIIITLIYYILDMIYWIYEARMKKMDIPLFLAETVTMGFMLFAASTIIYYRDSKSYSGWFYIINNTYFDLSAYITFAILLLELKILFNLHIFEFFGIEFAIIFGVFNEVLPFLVTLVLFIFIFTSSLHILLKLNSDSNENWNLVDFIIVPYTTLT